jgi:hypothetical protein
MIKRHQADGRARAAWRRLRHQRGQRAVVARVLETVAAMIPTVVLLLHLLFRHSGMAPVEAGQPAKFGLSVVEQLVVQSELTVVPEPNASALIAGGMGALFFLRSKGHAGCRPGDNRARTQASRIATAVA